MTSTLTDLPTASDDPVSRARQLIDRLFPAGIGVYTGGTIHLGTGAAVDLFDAATG